MGEKLLVVNYKNYEQVLGKKSVEMTKAIERAASEHPDVRVVVVPPAVELRMVAENTSLDVFAQHTSGHTPGSRTGEIMAESVKEAGAVGTLINHSEKRLTLAEISSAVKRAHSLGLETVVCTDTVETTGAAAALNPHFVAIEPPELIGGDISVSTARPELVSGAVDVVKKISPGVRVLCGAGVKTAEDVSKAVELGTVGVLLASGVVKARDPYRATLDILAGYE